MITPSSQTDLAHPNNVEANDLMQIRGIGRAKRQWLRQLFNIHTVHDLAMASAERIVSQLKAEGRTVSRQEIEGWITQAQQRLTAEPPSTTGEDCPPIAKAPVTSEAAISSNDGTETEWQTLSSFMVEFQLRSMSEQTELRTVAQQNATELVKIWTGVEGEQLCQWMLDQVSQQSHQPEPQAMASLNPMVLEIMQIRALQFPETQAEMVVNHQRRTFPGAIDSHQPFALEVSFQLVGAATAAIARRQVLYTVQVDARDRTTGTTTSLGITQPHPLIEGQDIYTTLLPEIILLPGIYRLQILASLQGVPAAPGYFKVPVLHVM